MFSGDQLNPMQKKLVSKLLLVVLLVACTNGEPASSIAATATPHLGAESRIPDVPLATEPASPTLTLVPTATTPQITPTTTPIMEATSYEYFAVRPRDTIRFLTFVAWEPDGYTLRYATQDDWTLNNWPSSEAQDWLWWQYDLQSGTQIPLPPPQSRVSSETRQMLSLCTFRKIGDESAEPCPGYSMLVESPFSEQIVFAPITTGDGETWLANTNGSTAKRIENGDGLPLAPSYVEWSSDGRWLIVGNYAYLLPKNQILFLMATDGSFVQGLEQITGYGLTHVNGLYPRFSPDGHSLAYVATDKEDPMDPDGYKLFVLDLNTLESTIITERVGLFQWADSGRGVYVLDGAVFPPGATASTGQVMTNLYYIDLDQSPPKETILARGIPYFPQSDSTSLWAYSEIAHALAYAGYDAQGNLGIVQLYFADKD